jgi:hypothetical protein
MCRKAAVRATPHSWDAYPVSDTNSIGALFRAHGEDYIRSYRPYDRVIRFIRSVRMCRTPALGWTVYTCTQCGKTHVIYKSCGNAQCPVCQSIKREQWMDKLQGRLLDVPYVHAVFTLPHQLNGLARANKNVMYGLVMDASWRSIREVFRTQGATPGMTSVLHTFGSDLKYHIHVHALVTFGGLGNQGQWIYPEARKRLTSYRNMCGIFKRQMLEELDRALKSGRMTYHLPLGTLLQELRKTRWVVHTTHPTAQTDHIKEYLGRYINRIAVSNSRLKYLEDTDEVALLYNDYKNQKGGCPAPKAIRHLAPLIAIDQIVQHVLPSHFQKSRHYGLHHAGSKIKAQAEANMKAHPGTVRTALEIISSLLNRAVLRCECCEGLQFLRVDFPPDRYYISDFLGQRTERAPPTTHPGIVQDGMRSPAAMAHRHAPR